jgi:hypothetical protein
MNKKIIVTVYSSYSEGTFTLASLTPMIVNTSKKAISRFSPNVRGCYTDEEFRLKTLSWKDGYRYSMKNCLHSSLLEMVMSNCSCVPDYYGHPTNESWKRLICR